MLSRLFVCPKCDKITWYWGEEPESCGYCGEKLPENREKV